MVILAMHVKDWADVISWQIPRSRIRIPLS
jgi:hypothetical protein